MVSVLSLVEQVEALALQVLAVLVLELQGLVALQGYQELMVCQEHQANQELQD
jgi:hypothetical protein